MIAPLAGEGCVEASASVKGDAVDQLFRGQAAHQDEVDEHAAIVLKRAHGHARDVRIRPVESQCGRVVVERRSPLRSAEPVPGGAAGSRGSVTDAWREDPQNPRTRVIATGEQRRSPVSFARCGGRGRSAQPSQHR